MSHTKGEWKRIICGTDELKPINSKETFLEFCEKCWDLTQKHGDAQKDFWGVMRVGKNGEDTVTIALCGNGPDGQANARFIAAAPDLLEACEYNNRLLTQNIGQATHAIALNEAAIAKAKKE